jgi:hypothetical protein
MNKPNKWVTPKRKGYQMECCNCGLTHAVDFRINRKYKNRDIIQFRVTGAKKKDG